ncbi:hypothetical protein DXV75_08355 [Alteromonas aestuariivivens]|uniref:Cellulose binding type IV domain-containing protein n=1 Tax=Alteromonas aestuariivivens TaxID=1938339 RepID=A0A3D8M872_9ALTE|nr:Ig-like domain-containing protein [Alteromonas aestuariivivens]RDV26081.1 hypothetical protein DXV75_08355 [Alteromonas aestuariivivens]
MTFTKKTLTLCTLLALSACGGSDDPKERQQDCSGADCQAAPNVAPTVSVTAPLAGSVFAIGEPIQIDSVVADSDGDIAKVSYYWNDSLIGEETSAPFQTAPVYVPVNASLGTNTITVVVMDDEGAETQTSLLVEVTEPNKPPTIALVMPDAQTPLVQGETVDFAVHAMDKDGQISSVDYYFDGQMAAQSTTGPDFSVSIELPEAGERRLKIVATDDLGETHVVEMMMTVAEDHGAWLFSPDKLYFKSTAPYDQLTVYWHDRSVNEDGFIVESSLDGSSDWQQIGQAVADETMAVIAEFDRQQTQYIRVRATRGEFVSEDAETLRIVGTADTLEVYPEVADISSGRTMTVAKDVYDDDGNLVNRNITFPIMQYQTPIDPSQGQATRVSTYFKVEVLSDEGEVLSSPVYETRPQIRNFLAQNDVRHTKKDNGLPGHRPYQYAYYGPQEGVSGSSLHSKHWTNFDAAEDVTVRVTLDPAHGVVDMGDLEIHPAPLGITAVDEQTFDVRLPGATDYTRHYRIAVNRKAWSESPLTEYRGSTTIEAPLFVFVNPMHVAPASAPEGEIREFNDGELVVYGPGIHLPDPNYQFLGDQPGLIPEEDGGIQGNATARELYVPGDAYLHYGFLFYNNSYPVKVWGRGIYSDEMFNLYTDDEGDEYGYVWSDRARSQWSHLDSIEGNPWGLTHAWETHVWFKGKYSAQPSVFQGLTNIGGRMGIVVDGANSKIVNHKDVGYGGSTYQTFGSRAHYVGNLLTNDDDITYAHEDYLMEYNTSYNMHNGPSFQFGWGSFNIPDITATVTNHTVWSSDRRNAAEGKYGDNHGVFNSRFDVEGLTNHSGGVFEDFDFYGRESLIFNINIEQSDSISTPDKIAVFGDKTFRNFTIREASYVKERLLTQQGMSDGRAAYIRFIHFDNLVIEDQAINDIDMFGQYFDYNEGLVLPTLTLFSMPESVTAPESSSAPIGQYIAMQASNGAYVHSDESVPVGLSPAMANGTAEDPGFIVTDAGDGFIALRDASGYYLKVDAGRYGYLHAEPDSRRGDEDDKDITENAKFIWVDNGDGTVSLYSKATGLFVRIEMSATAEAPLYAASSQVSDAEKFVVTEHTGDVPVFESPLLTEVDVQIEAETFVDANIAKVAGGGAQVGFIKSGAWVTYDVNLPNSLSDAVLKMSLVGGSVKQGTIVDVYADGMFVGMIEVPLAGPQTVTTELFTQNIGEIAQLTFNFSHPTDTGFLMDFDWFTLNYSVPKLTMFDMEVEAENYDANSGARVASGTKVGYIKHNTWVSYDLNLPASEINTQIELDLVANVKADSVINVYADDVLVGELTVAMAGEQTLSGSLMTAGIGPVGTLTLEFTHPTDTGFLMDLDKFRLSYGVLPVEMVSLSVEAEEYAANSGARAAGDGLGYVKNGTWVSYDLNLSALATNATLSFNLTGNVKADAEIEVLADGVSVGKAKTAITGAQTLSTTLSTYGKPVGTLTLAFAHATDTGFLLDVDNFTLEYGVTPSIDAGLIVEAEDYVANDGARASGGGTKLGYIKDSTSVTYDVNLNNLAGDLEVVLALVSNVKAESVITFYADGVYVGEGQVVTGGEQQLAVTLSTAALQQIDQLTLEFSHPTDTGFLMDIDWFEIKYLIGL